MQGKFFACFELGYIIDKQHIDSYLDIKGV